VTYTEPFAYELTLKSQSLLINTYYDFVNQSRFTPYVGVWVGVAWLTGAASNRTLLDAPANAHDIDATRESSKTTFAFAILAGTSYEITEKVSLDLGIRYFNFGTIKPYFLVTDNRWGPPAFTFDSNASTKVHGFDVSFGVRMSF
jgi:opacity protein-like surface antigen